MYAQEHYTDEERAILDRYFTNTELPVFAVVNLPEIVKGALFARYSRTHKPLRRLFLDDFYKNTAGGIETTAAYIKQNGNSNESNAIRQAEGLYDRIFLGYGDDSVAQLGGAHLACEQASGILAKIIERGRLAAYLEQSTRYIYYDEKLRDSNGLASFRYRIPPEIKNGPLADDYAHAMDRLFERYSSIVRRLNLYYKNRLKGQSSRERPDEFNRFTRGLACDAARGLLPAATTSNIGVFASGQAYENMLIRMNASPLDESREYSRWMLAELRKVIKGFLTRVDEENRGLAAIDYLWNTAREMEILSSKLPNTAIEHKDDNADGKVDLIDWDHTAEVKIIAAALYPYSHCSEQDLIAQAERMSVAERQRVIKAYVGERKNRRHKPGRAMERVYYTFDVLSDFGSFRDLQRHRIMTIDWQKLTPRHGYATPEVIMEMEPDVLETWRSCMSEMKELYELVLQEHNQDVAQYVVPFGFRIRYNIQMNARQAFHMLELRTDSSGHAAYRKICADMYRLIRDKAGHRAIASAMSFVDTKEHKVGRQAAEVRQADKRQTMLQLD